MKIAVIGCGAAGGTAAQFARKADRKAEIVLYDGEGYGQYSKCALPYVVEGMEWQRIIEFSPEWFRKQKIDYRNERVENVDLEARVIEDNEEDYDSIIIATGAIPYTPFKAEGVHFLRTIDDALSIRNSAKKAKNALIIGAGLIGMELAEALIHMKLDVEILEYMPSILPAMLDEDVADYIKKRIGVDVKTSCRVEKVENGIVTADEEYRADMVVVATGNKPVVINEGKRLKVDKFCRVEGMEDIYAAGDCTSLTDFFDRDMQVGLGSIAARQGRVAGTNAAGGEDEVIPPLFAKTTKLFGVEIASVGLLEREIDGLSAKYMGRSLPHYMEGEEILIKIVADGDGIVKGCQAVGEGAAKIIDRVSLAIYHEMNVRELARMENAYAPLVAPTFDAVEIACGMIERKLK